MFRPWSRNQSRLSKLHKVRSTHEETGEFEDNCGEKSERKVPQPGTYKTHIDVSPAFQTRQGQQISSHPKHPGRLCGLSRFLLNRHKNSCSGGKAAGTWSVLLVPRFRMSEAVMAQTGRNLKFNFSWVRTRRNGWLNMARYHWCSFKAGFLLTRWMTKQVLTNRTPPWSYFQLPDAISLEEGTFVAIECRQQPTYLGLHVNWAKYLPSFNKISTFSTDLHKSAPYQI